MIKWHILFLVILIGPEIFFQFVKILNLRYGEEMVDKKREDLEKDFEVDDPSKLLDYQRMTTGFSGLKSWIMLILTLFVLYSGIFSSAIRYIEHYRWSMIVSGTLFFIGLILIGQLLTLPFSAFKVFVIEEIFDFNRQTVGLWIKDNLKGLALTLIFTGILVPPILWFIEFMPRFWWIAAWGLIVLFGLIMQIIYPRIIAPIFNEFTPIEEEDLANAVEDLFDRAGFQCSEIYSMDASRRSSHSNAYFVGFGKTKRVVLFDTLIDQMEIPSVKSILAHELAHWKKSHVWKGVIRQALRTGIVFYVLYLLVKLPYLYRMFSVPEDALYAGLILGGLVISPVNRLLSPIQNYLSIKNEYEADEFAVQVTGEGEPLIQGLYKLMGENLTNPYPHSLYAAFYYTHPTFPKRIAHIKEIEAEL